MVFQHPRRCPFGHCRRARPHPRGDRLLRHCRRRSQGRPLCVLRHCLRLGVHWRSSRHDLRRHRRHRRTDGDAGSRPRSSVSLCRNAPDGAPADPRRRRPARPRHALRLKVGDDRFRERAGHPDFHGTAARTHRRPRRDLCDDRRRPRHHLSLSAGDAPHPVAARGYRGADRGRLLLGHGHPHGGRSGRTTGQPADLRTAAGAADLRDPRDHLPLFAGARRRRAAGIPADRQDRRRDDRHEQQQEPGMRRAGRQQHRLRPDRRHGRLRHDRPVGDQCRLRRARSPLDLRRRRLPSLPDPRPRRDRPHHTDGGARRRDDHGLHRHLLVALGSGPAPQSPAVVDRHAGNGRDRRGHP